MFVTWELPQPHKWPSARDILPLPPEDEPLCPHGVLTLTLSPPHSPRGKGPGESPALSSFYSGKLRHWRTQGFAEGPRPGRAEPGGMCWFPDSQHRSGPHTGRLSPGSRSPQDGLSPFNPASRSTRAAGTTARTSRNRSLRTEELRGLGCVLSVGSSPLKLNPRAFRDPLGRHCHLTPCDWWRQSVTKTRPVSRAGSETPALDGRRSKNFCPYF
uniref:Uncharacterized protein n=1 Tax=Pipistrellus kuhlii TaxID=59472 RepID=A0A7J7Y963_PIPKU|nr:hypothetical protein mPipKuh1_010314 [Pipistrellus kuhlii]